MTFTVERNDKEAIVRGPRCFEKALAISSIGVVLRGNVEDEWDHIPRPYTICVGSMTDAEVVACALGIQNFA